MATSKATSKALKSAPLTLEERRLEQKNETLQRLRSFARNL
jgi:hypothetical protein